MQGRRQRSRRIFAEVVASARISRRWRPLWRLSKRAQFMRVLRRVRRKPAAPVGILLLRRIVVLVGIARLLKPVQLR